ncbi:MAG TPA: DUF2846 domain-containing protein [Chitinophagaceae bacterium]|nr:DUF2846 domain-containing protein [Chitinophagaceae bacterium]
MRKLISTIISMIAFVTVTQAKANLKSPDSDSCYIYIYRTGEFGGALANFSIWVDDVKLCKLSNGRYFKVGVKPGTHTVSAKRGGVGIAKKETEVSVDCEAGKSNYVSCTMKSSFTRVRLNMEEVVEKTGLKEISDMKVDNCQAGVEDQ